MLKDYTKVPIKRSGRHPVLSSNTLPFPSPHALWTSLCLYVPSPLVPFLWLILHFSFLRALTLFPLAGLAKGL